MSAFEKVLQGIADTIKMNDRIVSIAEKIKELSEDVRNIDGRLIRIETLIEIAEKQKRVEAPMVKKARVYEKE